MYSLTQKVRGIDDGQIILNISSNSTCDLANESLKPVLKICANRIRFDGFVLKTDLSQYAIYLIKICTNVTLVFRKGVKLSFARSHVELNEIFQKLSKFHSCAF